MEEHGSSVVICLKIRTFVVSATTNITLIKEYPVLWFAWKFVPLWYQQQRVVVNFLIVGSCDLLENSYLCGISNNMICDCLCWKYVVICLKIRTFVVSATTLNNTSFWLSCCDLLENSYLCGISNNVWCFFRTHNKVVICLKIRTFVVSATTNLQATHTLYRLWFAWKFVPLWYQQQPFNVLSFWDWVVICLKIRTFVVSATT